MGVGPGDVSVGDQREAVLVEGLTRTQIVQYAGASGDFNPLHTDEVFVTRAAGYPAVFAHGMLTGDTLRGLGTVEAVHSQHDEEVMVGTSTAQMEASSAGGGGR